jgi:hypothetical protein
MWEKDNESEEDKIEINKETNKEEKIQQRNERLSE